MVSRERRAGPACTAVCCVSMAAFHGHRAVSSACISAAEVWGGERSWALRAGDDFGGRLHQPLLRQMRKQARVDMHGSLPTAREDRRCPVKCLLSTANLSHLYSETR